MILLLTKLRRAAKSIVVMRNMKTRPMTIRVLRPAFSIRTRDTNVIRTFMEPMPSVAD